MVVEMFRRFFLVLTFRLPSGVGTTENKMKGKRKVFPLFARRAMELYYAESYEEKFSPMTKTFVPLGNETALVCIFLLKSVPSIFICALRRANK